MKKILLILLVLAIAVLAFVFYRQKKSAVETVVDNNSPVAETGQSGSAADNAKNIEIIAENLDIPWDIAFLPDGDLLVTERPGRLKKIGTETVFIPVADVVSVGEGGLLGLALHPEFSQNRWVYLYFTTRSGGALKNMVARYTFSGTELTEKTIILDNIPAGSNHDGGRIAFGPDGFLYITTGDSGNESLAQNTNSLAGKILRVGADGSLPEDNPFSNPVYSYGHRNVQGITWDAEGNLWATEHGRSGIASGYDELNLIKKGANYGWPDIQGNETRTGMEAPVIHSGATTTWAPSGATHLAGKIFFAGLRGQAIYEYDIVENKLAEHFKGEFGRLRRIILGPDGNFFALTNNTDGRGTPRAKDDKLIRLAPAALGKSEKITRLEKAEEKFLAPLDEASQRITKKTFGLFITPETSPVQPDKFRGFHTGVDWEVLPEELAADVPIKAVCSGTLKLKKMASGYGGVAIQECELSGEPVTVIYGHLDLESVKLKIGGKIEVGETIGFLGAHESLETDGARKHLHLAIHRGKNLELKGYIGAQAELSSWVDPCLYGCCKS